MLQSQLTTLACLSIPAALSELQTLYRQYPAQKGMPSSSRKVKLVTISYPSAAKCLNNFTSQMRFKVSWKGARYLSPVQNRVSLNHPWWCLSNCVARSLVFSILKHPRRTVRGIKTRSIWLKHLRSLSLALDSAAPTILTTPRCQGQKIIDVTAKIGHPASAQHVANCSGELVALCRFEFVIHSRVMESRTLHVKKLFSATNIQR